MTPNEGREGVNLPVVDDDDEMNRVRVPANVAGSAVNPEEGGRPGVVNGE